jgi:hypothetical protein
MILALLTALAQADPPREALEVLTSFEEDLRKAIRPNVDRAALRRAAKETFDKNIARATVKAPKLIWEHFNEYVSRLDVAERAFASKDHRQERQLWVGACRTTLLKIGTFARVPDEAPSTLELFTACVEAVLRVRSRISGEDVDDLRLSAYESINLVARGQMRRCRAPKGDPKAAHASQMSQIDLRFGKSNDLPQRMLRDISKSCLDRDISALR